ncbi:hypothetical protein BJ912DRAFT_1043700 [Pholiota molesta]|nr:hypothetical protein BJ912DRAFT_1043700 [Pholiota molesta]
MSNNIPPEIWLYISQFIPDDDIYRQLRTINSVFFHLAMASKYEEVVIRWNAVFPTLSRIMERLSDPFVAGKVRRVTVEFIRYPQARGLRRATRKDKMFTTIHTWMSSASRFLPPFKSRQARTLGAIAKYFYDGADVSIPPKFVRHLASAWSTFGANLQSLSIRTELLVFQELSALKPYFQNLTALKISSIPVLSQYRTDFQVGSTPGLDAVAPLINSIGPNLKNLSLNFLGFYHLPDIFPYLSTSLALEALKVKMMSRKGKTWDDAGLKAFLCGGAHVLRELDINIGTLYQDSFSYSTLGKVLLDCATDRRCFSHLETLRINPTTGPARIDVLCTSIQRASDALKIFTIYDIELSQEEALIVIDALSNCSSLAYVRLQFVHLDITIIDSMATNLTGLKRLDLRHDMDIMPLRNLTAPPPRRDFDTFRKRSYPNWKLEDVSIYFDCWAEADVAMMEAFAHSVPAIKSFCGRGHMGKIEDKDMYRPSID